MNARSRSNAGVSASAALAIAVGVSIAAWGVLSLGFTAGLNFAGAGDGVAIFGGDATTRLNVARVREPAAEQQPATVAPDPAAAAETRAIAVAALKAEPLSVDAFRELARAAQQQDDPVLAGKLLAEAFRRSFRNTNVDAQLLQASLTHGDLEASALYVDALLRTRPELIDGMKPLLVAIADQPSARAALVERLRARPPWRSAFLVAYGLNAKHEQAFIDIYSELKDRESPMSTNELRPFLATLVAQNRVDTALSVWLSTLPESTALNPPLLYNADFTLPFNDSPFNWALSDPQGVSLQVVELPGKPGLKGLEIDFLNSRAPFSHVAQTLTLTPGEYTFKGQVRTEDFRNPRGMVWRVYCGVAAMDKIGETPLLQGGPSAWRSFSMTFEVPAQDCPSQLLRLELAARIPSETLASGSVLFGELALSAAP